MAADQEQEPYVEPTYLTRKEVEEMISCGRYGQLIYPDNCVVLEKLALKPWRPYGRVERDDYDYTNLDFTEVSMRDANLTMIRLHKATFDKADLTNAVAAPSLLKHTSFNEAILTGMNFCSSSLQHAEFQDASMHDVCMVNVDARHADFRGADLTDANLAMANFFGANFRGANLTNADLDGSDMSMCNFSGANLTNANLEYTYLSMCDFSGANLTKAKFCGATMHGVKLHDAIYEWIQLSGVRHLHAIPRKKAEEDALGWY